MKQRQSILLVLCLFLISTLCGCAIQPEKSGSRWVSLFNGKNLDGWKIKITGYDLKAYLLRRDLLALYNAA
jgi:hypothetical protein